MKSDLLSIVLFAITFIFGIPSLRAEPSKPTQAVLVGLLIFFCFAALYLVASSKFGLVHAFHTLQACSSLGIRRIYPKGKQSPASSMSERIAAAKDLRIMAVSGQSIIKLHGTELVAALRDGSALIRVLVAESDSQFVQDVEATESESRGGQIRALTYLSNQS